MENLSYCLQCPRCFLQGAGRAGGLAAAFFWGGKCKGRRPAVLFRNKSKPRVNTHHYYKNSEFGIVYVTALDALGTWNLKCPVGVDASSSSPCGCYCIQGNHLLGLTVREWICVHWGFAGLSCWVVVCRVLQVMDQNKWPMLCLVALSPFPTCNLFSNSNVLRSLYIHAVNNCSFWLFLLQWKAIICIGISLQHSNCS